MFREVTSSHSSIMKVVIVRMKSVTLFLLAISFPLAMASQPGNGNGNGRGNGNCPNPPCGGPNQPVPIDTQWLLYVGVAVGVYLRFQIKKKDIRS
jgi:hypothetical protein